MAKKNRDHQLEHTFDQDAFTRALHLVEGWAGLSASEEELDRLGSLLAGHSDAYQPLFTEVNKFAATLVPCLTKVQAWGKTDSQTLALLVCGGEAVRRGVRTCAPASLALPSATHQLSLYLVILHSRATNLGIDPWPWVRHVVGLWTLGPRAVREVLRRCKQHVGFRYGLTSYLWNKPDTEEELRNLLKEIQWLSFNHLSGEAKRAVRDRMMRQTDVKDTVVPELVSALSGVLDRKHLRADPLNGLLEALNGKLNVLPLAVANQLAKDLKPIRRYRTVRVDIESGASAKLNPRPPAPAPPLTRTRERDEPAATLDALPALNTLSALETLLEKEELDAHERQVARMQVVVRELCAQSAKHRVGHEAAIKVWSQVELAAQHRRSRQTIARWEAEFLSALRERLRKTSTGSTR